MNTHADKIELMGVLGLRYALFPDAPVVADGAVEVVAAPGISARLYRERSASQRANGRCGHCRQRS